MSNKKSTQEVTKNAEELSFEAIVELLNEQISPNSITDSFEKELKNSTKNMAQPQTWVIFIQSKQKLRAGLWRFKN